MKKHIITLAFFIFVATLSSYAQTIHLKVDQVPAKTKMGFTQKYPQATDAIWAKDESGLYTAQFWDADNNVYINAYMEEDGTWSKTVMELTPASFTEAIRQYLKTNYKDVPVSSVLATQENNGKYTYKIVLETETKLITLFMDKQANILKQVEEVINIGVSDK
jgi:hypothetical protein